MIIYSLDILLFLFGTSLPNGNVSNENTISEMKNPFNEMNSRLDIAQKKSQTRLSAFTFTFHFHALEKEMATHSSVLAWRIPESGEPGGLPSMGSHRIGHD